MSSLVDGPYKDSGKDEYNLDAVPNGEHFLTFITYSMDKEAICDLVNGASLQTTPAMYTLFKYMGAERHCLNVILRHYRDILSPNFKNIADPSDIKSIHFIEFLKDLQSVMSNAGGMRVIHGILVCWYMNDMEGRRDTMIGYFLEYTGDKLVYKNHYAEITEEQNNAIPFILKSCISGLYKASPPAQQLKAAERPRSPNGTNPLSSVWMMLSVTDRMKARRATPFDGVW